MDKPYDNRAWFLVLPVLAIVAFSAVIPLMTVVNFSVQDEEPGAIVIGLVHHALPSRRAPSA